MACRGLNSCKGMGSCGSKTKSPDNSVGMDRKRDSALKGHASKAALHRGENKIATVEKEFHRGKLHSGSGQKVTNPKQAIAIALSEARSSDAYIPKKHADIMPTPVYKNQLEQYGLSSMKDNRGADVNGPSQAKQLASSRSGQSYNDNVRKFRNADRFGIRRK